MPFVFGIHRPMTLPKNSRKIEVDGIDYRWMLGKRRKGPENMDYADIVIERQSDGELVKHEVCLGDKDTPDEYKPEITPSFVKEIILTEF